MSKKRQGILYFRLIHVNRNSHEFRSSHQSHSHVLLSVNIRQIFVRTSCHVTVSRPQESKPADIIVHYWMYPSSRHKNNSKSTFFREKGLGRGTWPRKMAAKGVVTSDLYKRLNSASIIWAPPEIEAGSRPTYALICKRRHIGWSHHEEWVAIFYCCEFVVFAYNHEIDEQSKSISLNIRKL